MSTQSVLYNYSEATRTSAEVGATGTDSDYEQLRVSPNPDPGSGGSNYTSSELSQ